MSDIRPSLNQLIDKNNLIGVEIGVQLGKNAKSILDNLDIKRLYLIDPYVPYPNVSGSGNGMAGTVEAHENAFKEAKKRLKYYDDKIIWIRRHSWWAFVRFNDYSLDFVYIDGDHRYNSVKADISLYYTKVKIGGLICGHDASHKQVKDAVHDFFNNRSEVVQKIGADWYYIKNQLKDSDSIYVCTRCNLPQYVTSNKWKCKKCSMVNYINQK